MQYFTVAHTDMQCSTIGSYHYYIVYIDTQEGDALIDTKQDALGCNKDWEG